MAKGNAHDYMQNNCVSVGCAICMPIIRIRYIMVISEVYVYLFFLSSDKYYVKQMQQHNVLIADGGQALLTDFGLSQLFESSFVLENNAPSVKWTVS